MTGTRLGHYRILEKLGAGGMGEVYRAHDEQLQRDVAIKVLLSSGLADPVARTRLLREARSAAALNHSSICTIHEVGEADGQAYIAMELVDGQPLSALVQGGRKLPIDDVVQYARQVADALSHAHARQIVHRDLKLANLIATSEGRVKVLDFGVAKRMESGVVEATTLAPATLTEPGSIVGTIAYMAPEQLRGEPADAQSDVWALGVVMYELATGVRPFAGTSSFDVSARILNEPPAPLGSAVPAALQGVILRCLEKQASRRFASADHVRDALDAFAGGRPLAPAEAVNRRRWLAPAVGTAALVAVLLAMSVPWIRGRVGLGVTRVQSIAVLPLDNLSGDAAQDFFADGMTEVLSTDLARLAGLKRVTARGSVVRFKGTRKPLQDIARELKVDALLTGSVLLSGNRVSITAHLLDPATGDQLWANRYERDLKDVLVLRNEIVSAIVGEIRAQLSADDRARLGSAPTVNADAFEAYLKGRFHWLKQTPGDYDLAERYYQLALDKDPGYAVAYAGLASVWMMRGDTGFRPPSETTPKALELIAKALQLDDRQADVHVARGNISVVNDWDWAGAEREYQRALDVNPNSADAHFFNADLQLVLNHPDRWETEIQRALDLDPLNDFYWSFYGWHLNYRRRYDEAIPIFQRLLPTGPNKASNYLGLWGAYHRKGMYAEAVAAARGYFQSAGDGEFTSTLGVGRDAAEYRASMKRTGEAMVARSTQRHIPALRVARMFAHAGDADSAMHWLEVAYERHESALERLALVWDWLDLHGDPRFQALVRRMKLPAVTL